MERILDVGCGSHKMKNAIGIDITPNTRADIIADITTGFPIKTEAFNTVYCNHVLEHIDNTLFIMNELERILKKSGRLVIRCPFYNSFGAFVDPTHCHYFSEKSFTEYFTDGGDMHRIGATSFKLIKVDLKYNPKLWFIPFKKKLRFFIPNLCTEFLVELEKV